MDFESILGCFLVNFGDNFGYRNRGSAIASPMQFFCQILLSSSICLGIVLSSFFCVRSNVARRGSSVEACLR